MKLPHFVYPFLTNFEEIWAKFCSKFKSISEQSSLQIACSNSVSTFHSKDAQIEKHQAHWNSYLKWRLFFLVLLTERMAKTLSLISSVTVWQLDWMYQKLQVRNRNELVGLPTWWLIMIDLWNVSRAWYQWWPIILIPSVKWIDHAISELKLGINLGFDPIEWWNHSWKRLNPYWLKSNLTK